MIDQQLNDLINLFYQVHHIPLYCYREDDNDPFYSAWFSDAICQIPKITNDLYIYTDDHFYTWGIIQKHATNEFVLIGPVFSIALNDDEKNGFIKANPMLSEFKNESMELLNRIPVTPYSTFFSIVKLLFYQINGSVLDDDSFLSFLLPNNEKSLQRSNYYKDSSKSIDEFLSFDKAQAVEELILHCIETNDIGTLKKTLIDPTLDFPNIGKTPMSQMKLSSMSMITVISRFVITKGMNANVSLRLSDLYIQAIENAVSTEELRMIMLSAYTEYAQKLQMLNSIPASSALIKDSIQFIRQNTNTVITPADVADFVKKSLPYLSTQFKKETGVTISSFIQKCKIDEAKSLLKHTDMTVTEISNYLCFYDQSYFHREFKKNTGLTPIHYRNAPSN